MRIVRQIIIFTFLLFIISTSRGSVYYFTDSGNIHYIGKFIQIFEDNSGLLTFEQVRNSEKFEISKDDIPNFKITKSTFWLKVELENETYDPTVILTLAYPVLDCVEFYAPDNAGHYTVEKTGEQLPIAKRKFHNQNFIFDLNIPHGES